MVILKGFGVMYCFSLYDEMQYKFLSQKDKKLFTEAVNNNINLFYRLKNIKIVTRNIIKAC